MKNKINQKKYILKTLIASLLIIILFLIINAYEYHSYTKNFNKKINSILLVVKEQYPSITEEELIKIINQENDSDELVKKYGINLETESIIESNEKDYHIFIIQNVVFLISSILILFLIFYHYDKKKEKEIEEITKYLEELNKKNYILEIENMSEDELSILRNELYKTTVLLREDADNSKKDKINLKKSLEDISHQLKTPLTSIFILLDNMIDNEDMDSKIREEFLNDMKRELINMNFLIQSLLKLSKLESNTINFQKEEHNIEEIIEESISNLSTICDLKNIKILKKIDDNIKITCDSKWQIEAITNILKNCIDHSKENSKIEIHCSENNSYIKMNIKDEGDGISKEDLPHIFERFYKGENSKKDSIGIGLALAKSIIEEDNGKISVTSSNKGTEFIIKYFKI